MLPALSLVLLAASLALAVYGLGLRVEDRLRGRAAQLMARLRPPEPGKAAGRREPDRKAESRPPRLRPPRLLVWSHNRAAQLLRRAGLPAQPELLILACVGTGFLVARFVSPLGNPPFSALAGVASALAPLIWVRNRAAERALAIGRGVGPALTQLSRLAKVRHHPYLALVDATPSFPHPLRPEYEQALHEYRAGQPLGESLRAAATRLGGNYYLVQLAELAELSLQYGSDFAYALGRLVDRYRLVEELRAEERTQLHGYGRFTWLLFVASQVPVAWLLLRQSPDLRYFAEYPAARLLLVWNLVTGLLVACLPGFLSYDEG